MPPSPSPAPACKASAKATTNGHGLDDATLAKVLSALADQGRIQELQEAVADRETKMRGLEKELKETKAEVRSLKREKERERWAKTSDKIRRDTARRTIMAFWAVDEAFKALGKEMVLLGQSHQLGGPSEYKYDPVTLKGHFSRISAVLEAHAEPKEASSPTYGRCSPAYMTDPIEEVLGSVTKDLGPPTPDPAAVASPAAASWAEARDADSPWFSTRGAESQNLLADDDDEETQALTQAS